MRLPLRRPRFPGVSAAASTQPAAASRQPHPHPYPHPHLYPHPHPHPHRHGERTTGAYRQHHSYTAPVALFEPILRALNEREVRYVVVGGFATVMHGYARLTADLDLVVDLEPHQAARAVHTLTGLGLQPRPPVDAIQFADPAARRQWIEERGLKVFSFWDPEDPLREVDLFVEHPIEFEDLWKRSDVITLGGLPIRIACIDDLISLKRLADRPQDRADIEALEAIAARGKKRNG